MQYPLTNKEYSAKPERLIKDLNGLLLENARDVAQLLADAITQNANKYGVVLKLARRLNRLGAFTLLAPLIDTALNRFPNSIDLAILQVDCAYALGKTPDIERLYSLTEISGRKRSQTAERLQQPERTLELLAAPDTQAEFLDEDLIMRVRTARLAGISSEADAAFDELRRRKTVAAWRGILQLTAQRDGPVTALDNFEDAPAPKAELAPMMLRQLVQTAPALAQKFYHDHGGAEIFGWQMASRMLALGGDTEAAFAECILGLKGRERTAFSEADYTLLAQTALDAGKCDTARVALADGLRLFPTSIRLINLAGQRRFRQGDWHGATAFLEDYYKKFPNNRGILSCYRNMLIQTGDYVLASTVVDDAPDLRTRENELLSDLRLARVTGNLHQVTSCVRHLTSGSYLAREKALVASTEALVLEGELAEAYGRISAGMAEFPNSAELFILWGKIAFLAGDIALARSIRNRFHALSPSGSPVLDTPDLVLGLADQASEINGVLTSEQGLDQLLEDMPDAENPTAWMQFMYRWIHCRTSGPSAGTRTIPNTFLTYWEGEINPPVAMIIAEWKALLPGAVHEHFDLARALKWLEEWGLNKAVDLMRAAESPATRADIFRVAYLTTAGGIYIDTDERPIAGIDDWLTGADLVLVAEKGHFTLANSFIACVPNHPVLQNCLERILAEGADFKGGLSTWIETGPGLLTLEVGRYIHTQTAMSGDVPGLRLLLPQEYSARVATTLKLPHKFLIDHWRNDKG